VRKATLASILRKATPGVRLNEHLEHPEGGVVFQRACKMGLEGIVLNPHSPDDGLISPTLASIQI
jgi:ATP-dependent DNA ligase